MQNGGCYQSHFQGPLLRLKHYAQQQFVYFKAEARGINYQCIIQYLNTCIWKRMPCVIIGLLSPVLSGSCEDIELSEERQTSGTSVVGLKNSKQLPYPFFKLHSHYAPAYAQHK